MVEQGRTQDFSKGVSTGCRSKTQGSGGMVIAELLKH